MTRNNEDRLGAKKPDANPPVVSSDDGRGEGFSFAVPTDFVELPSGGRFYDEEHPLHDKEFVEIKFMTAREEDILSSRSLLKKGVAIDRMLKNILVDKAIDVDNLLIGDKNAIIIAARVTGYGEDYETKVVCPSCASSVEHNFNLGEKEISRGGLECVEEGLGIVQNANTFTIPLPKTKVDVEVRLLCSKDETKLAKLAESKKKNKLPEAPLTDQLKSFIISVNGRPESALIAEFIDVLPAIDSKYLRNIYGKLTPHVDLAQEFQCEVCDFVENMEVPFTTDFFWSR
tara:strand:+ start:13349 stop:14209 length:861 start_codon:yes stop_codon:yes gene_type:complete